MGDVCTDGRFDLIERFKRDLVDATNIETSPEEMAVLDSILFRMWQMGWLDRLEQPAASPWHRAEDELPPKATWVLTVATDENVKLFNIATVDAGGQWWTCSPQNILRELFGVRYWMPIEPPKEDA